MEGSDTIYVGMSRIHYECDRIASLLVVLREQLHNALHLLLSVGQTLDAVFLDRDAEVVAVLHPRYPQEDPQTERIENGNGVADFLAQIVRDVNEQLIVTNPNTTLPD